MADKTIRVSEETWRDLRAQKAEGESFDDVIARLTRDKWDGFGALSETGVPEGTRTVHRELGEELTERIGEPGP